MLALKANTQAVTRLAFSADGTRVAAAGPGKKVHVWNLTSGRLKAKTFATTSGPVAWLGFLADGTVLALETYGRYVVFDPDTGARTAADLGSGRWVGRIVASADRSVFYGTGNEAQRWNFDGRLNEVWNVRVPDTKTDVVTGRGGVVILPDGTVVAAVSNGRSKTWLHTRDAATGKLLHKRLVAASVVRDLAVLPDGKTFLFVREQGASKAATNAVVAGTKGKPFEPVIAAPPQAQLTALALHPSGRWVTVGQSDGLVRTFEAHTWVEVSAYGWGKSPVNCVAFAPDGLKAAAAFDEGGQFVLWDVDL